MPGPRKKPTSELHSWRAKLAERQNEIQVAKPRRPPVCPKWLTGKAREYWRDLSKGQHAAGLLTALDVLPFGVICSLASEADAYAEQVGDETLVTWVSGDSTSERLNPLLKHRLETIKVMMKICNDMGMTPTARIGLPQPAETDRKKGEVIDSKKRFPKG